MKREAKIDKYVNGNTKGIKVIPRSPRHTDIAIYRYSRHNQNRDKAITSGKAIGRQQEKLKQMPKPKPLSQNLWQMVNIFE